MKKSGLWVIYLVIALFVFGWKVLYTDTARSSSGYTARMNSDLSGIYTVMVDNGIAEEKIVGEGRYKNMAFSPSGKYLIIER